VVWPHPPTPSP